METPGVMAWFFLRYREYFLPLCLGLLIIEADTPVLAHGFLVTAGAPPAEKRAIFLLTLWIVLGVLLLAVVAGGLWYVITRQRNSRWYYNRAIDCYEREAWEKALDYLSKAYELEPDYPPIAYNIGVVFLNMGDMEQAKTFFEAALQLDDKDVSALYNLGFIYYEEGNYERALANWQQAEYLSEDDDSELLFCLGIAYEAMEDEDLATAILFKAVGVDGSHLTARMTLGRLLEKQERLDEALEQYQAVLEQNANDAEAYYEAALCLLKQGKWQAASRYSKKMLALEPQSGKAYNQLGLASYCMDDARGAISAYLKAIELEPDYATVWSNLAYAYEKLGYTDKAIEAFEQYVELEQNPDDIEEAHQHLAYLRDKWERHQQPDGLEQADLASLLEPDTNAEDSIPVLPPEADEASHAIPSLETTGRVEPSDVAAEPQAPASDELSLTETDTEKQADPSASVQSGVAPLQ